jgi:hypothetical protein
MGKLSIIDHYKQLILWAGQQQFQITDIRDKKNPIIVCIRLNCTVLIAVLRPIISNNNEIQGGVGWSGGGWDGVGVGGGEFVDPIFFCSLICPKVVLLYLFFGSFRPVSPKKKS